MRDAFYARGLSATRCVNKKGELLFETRAIAFPDNNLIFVALYKAASATIKLLSICICSLYSKNILAKLAESD
jgi:hypothetical protein